MRNVPSVSPSTLEPDRRHRLDGTERRHRQRCDVDEGVPSGVRVVAQSRCGIARELDAHRVAGRVLDLDVVIEIVGEPATVNRRLTRADPELRAAAGRRIHPRRLHVHRPLVEEHREGGRRGAQDAADAVAGHVDRRRPLRRRAIDARLGRRRHAVDVVEAERPDRVGRQIAVDVRGFDRVSLSRLDAEREPLRVGISAERLLYRRAVRHEQPRRNDDRLGGAHVGRGADDARRSPLIERQRQRVARLRRSPGFPAAAAASA